MDGRRLELPTSALRRLGADTLTSPAHNVQRPQQASSVTYSIHAAAGGVSAIMVLPMPRSPLALAMGAPEE